VRTDDLVRNRPARERDVYHASTRRIDGLANGFRYLVRLARCEANLALTVADGNESIERKAASALHDLRDAVDRDDVLYEIAALAAATIVAAASVTTASAAATFAAAATAFTTAAALTTAATTAAATGATASATLTATTTAAATTASTASTAWATTAAAWTATAAAALTAA
jgi:hypothetical protein